MILLGCVDNNKSRQLCHRVFEQKRNLIYIDAGNGEHTGQVVCGVRQHGRTLYKPVDVYKRQDCTRPAARSSAAGARRGHAGNPGDPAGAGADTGSNACNHASRAEAYTR